jgi:3-phosphoshikimate 1-carboxyvinyltransferase
MSAVLIHPLDRPLEGETQVPRSKPHMQRAILLSLLANAPSIIVHPDWSSESQGLYEAAQRFGLEIAHHDEARLVVTGAGRSLSQPGMPVQTAGSAFNFRTTVALACLVPAETIVEGAASMKARPVVRYLNFVHDLGAWIEDISDSDHLRVRVRGGRQLGGETTIDTQHSSQVLTAALLIAPAAGAPVRIHCGDSGLVGEGYVDLTLDMMREQGAAVTREGNSFVIAPGVYQSRLHLIPSDFTALSYLAGAVAVAEKAQVTIAHYRPSSLSSEREFLAVLRMLGVDASYDPVARSLHIQRTSPEADSIEIDGRNIPTIVPVLAAIAPFVEAKVTVRNVAHVNNHKCPRVSVMIRELNRMGCRIAAVYRSDGMVDGFSASGRQRPAGGVVLDSHGDHRIFMSLATAALGARSATGVDGAQHLRASFTDYLDAMKHIGVRWDPAGSLGEAARTAVATTGTR